MNMGNTLHLCIELQRQAAGRGAGLRSFVIRTLQGWWDQACDTEGVGQVGNGRDSLMRGHASAEDAIGRQLRKFWPECLGLRGQRGARATGGLGRGWVKRKDSSR